MPPFTHTHTHTPHTHTHHHHHHQVLFLYGKNDLACNYVGAKAMAESLPWAGAAGFRAAPLGPFAPVPTGTDDRARLLAAGLGPGGEAQAFRPEGGGALLWVQVAAAGHMVPLDEPPSAAAALALLMDQI